MSIKLIIDGNIIVESPEGTYSVPKKIPLPLRLERFIIVDGTIKLEPSLVGLKNSEIDAFFSAKEMQAGFEEIKNVTIDKIWNLLAEKTQIVMKQIRGKPAMSDEDFALLIKMDKTRVVSAQKGLDVFELQSIIAGITQAEMRALIITRAEEWELSLFVLDDQIEGVRKVLEGMVNNATSIGDLMEVGVKVALLNELTGLSTSEHIASILL